MTEYMVLTENAEQKRALEAFLKALKIRFLIPDTSTLTVLEARLKPKQRLIWDNLKTAIQDVKNGTAEGTSWEDFKKELANENSIAQTV